ncbi:MAG: tRNA pseudouridine(55) synthase TruB [Desulfobulbus sp.]|nr:MAG: tRNA pseudouridine(55) synthase TruB [Desulfobulbus sp.]
MAKRKPVLVDGQELSAGVFIVDKPVGCTSFAVVKKIRWLLGIKKVGHAGTLDPFASGVLVVCAGRPATRHIDSFMMGKKTYQARLQLGVETETLDTEGVVTDRRPVPELHQEKIVEVLQEFAGPQMQVPPAYSAAKHKGKPLYHYARQGIMITKEAKPIEIYSLDVNGYDAANAQLDITVSCSRGTYIRVLAADIGNRFGCGAHLVGLRRSRSGCFSVDEAISGEHLLTEDEPLESLLAGMISVEQALGKC